MLQKIEIDWEIHKLIESERRGFDEPPYKALRRLLGLPENSEHEMTQKPTAVSTGVPWIEDGVVVPHGSLARMEYDYGRQVYEGKFLNGKLVVNGMEFHTLSGAASEVAITKAVLPDMIARGSGNNAGIFFRLRKLQQLVIGTANFERKHWLEGFALK